MRTRLASLLALIFFFAPSASSSAAGDRYALLIANAKYPDADAPLKEPVNDARDVAAELKRGGFKIDVGENLTREAMRRAFDRLYAKIKSGDAVLLFFSGYGIQSGRQSYMIPVDARIWQESDVRRDGFSLDTALNEINSRGAGVKIALLDASRRNPYERRFRSFSAGLAPVLAPNETLVMYSAALSSVIPDNGGNHGLFAQELITQIRVPDLMAEEALKRTREGVMRASAEQQIPWISSSLAEDFSFVPSAGGPRAGKTASGESSADRATAPAEPALADDPTIKSLTGKIDANPEDVNARYRRGQVYASKGAYNLAIKDFDETIRLNPKYIEALNNRCWVRTVLGDLEGALKDCNEALRLRPNFVDALDSRGLVNLKAGTNKDAIADFDAALKINPRLTSSLYGRGLAKQRTGSISEGNLDIANAKAMDPNIVQEFAGYGVH
ncbi:MAG: caspase family protein [Bradyrhizobium sp.]|nr:caspase family protein [Bradyrhizobium sp.]